MSKSPHTPDSPTTLSDDRLIKIPSDLRVFLQGSTVYSPSKIKKLLGKR